MRFPLPPVATRYWHGFTDSAKRVLAQSSLDSSTPFCPARRGSSWQPRSSHSWRLCAFRWGAKLRRERGNSASANTGVSMKLQD